MHHRATRQETLQRRKIVYRDASGADEEESSEPALVESTSNKPKVSVQEQEKLQKLEDELARLRSEMSRFLNAAQAQQQHSSGDDLEDSMTPQKMNADPEAGFRTPAPTRRSSSVIPQAPPLPGANSAVPPPPPLPVPSTPKSFKKASSDDMDVDDKENQPANNAAAPATPSSQTEPPKPSLAELVRSASSRGSLRRVDGERSPGGTLKRKPSVSSGPASNNHTDVIAHALRMKFKVRIFPISRCSFFPPETRPLTIALVLAEHAPRLSPFFSR